MPCSDLRLRFLRHAFKEVLLLLVLAKPFKIGVLCWIKIRCVNNGSNELRVPFSWVDKITPGFAVKSSYHLRNKEDSKFSICAPCKCSCNCHGRARHKPRDFQNLKGKVAANALDISVTLFDAIDLENSTFILTRRGTEAILFLTKS